MFWILFVLNIVIVLIVNTTQVLTINAVYSFFQPNYHPLPASILKVFSIWLPMFFLIVGIVYRKSIILNQILAFSLPWLFVIGIFILLLVSFFIF
jgi:hypothetical protein